MVLKLKDAIVDTLGLRLTYPASPHPHPTHATLTPLLASGLGLLASFLRRQSTSLNIAPRGLELQRGSRELAQWEQHLLCRQEGLSSDP